MEIIFVIILIIGSIIIFKNKDKRFPNNPILGWLVCTIILALSIGLYLMYSPIDSASRDAAFNAGYKDALK